MPSASTISSPGPVTDPAHLVRLQAYLVDRLKRRAIRLLRDDARAHAPLLHVYAWAEEATEGELFQDLRALDVPPWLADQLERHLGDERRHAKLLRDALAGIDARPFPIRLEPFRDRNIARLRRLIDAHAGRFENGAHVPLLAVAWRMERMSVRVLARHVEVLDEPPSALAEIRALLAGILADERRHVLACERALEKLLRPEEAAAFGALVHQIDRQERAWGITGALAMLATSWWVRRTVSTDSGR